MRSAFPGFLRRVLLLFSALACLASLCLPALAEEDELMIEEIVENIDLDAVVYGDVPWDFPVPLEDMEPDYVRLANKHYLLEKDFYAAPLVTVKSRKADRDGNNTNGGMLKASGSKMQLQETCCQALVAMSEAARQEGHLLYLKSAYRSYQTQNTMYYNRLKRNNGRDDGWVAMPGSSDHQTGLGCDVVPRSWKNKSMNGKMGREPECIWMEAHCHEFGFILRYPEDKEDITEINYEPWHLRYVGPAAAAYIMENGLCLEEFVDQLQAAIDRFLSAGGDPKLVEAFIQTPADASDGAQS